MKEVTGRNPLIRIGTRGPWQETAALRHLALLRAVTESQELTPCMKGTQGPWGGVNAWDAPSPGEAPDRAIAARLRAAQRACEEQCQVRLECVELMLAQTEITKRGKGGTKVKCHATGVYAGTVCYDPLIPDLNERIETLMNKGEE